MKIKDLVRTIDQFAPFFLQEKFDNSGVQFADTDGETGKILLCLDVTREVIDESLKHNCPTILSHHPLIFHPLTRVTKQDHPVLFQLIFHKLNLIAAHTNFDLAENGLNDYVGRLLGLNKTDCLEESPEKTLKLAIYVPEKYQENLTESLFRAGAGKIGHYNETSFRSIGQGSFKPMDGTSPFIGKIGKREIVNEVKIETVFLERDLNKIIEAIRLNHPYEEPAFDIYQIETRSKTGIGLVAELDSQQTLEEISQKVKKAFKAPYLKIVSAGPHLIQRIALCTGGGGSLIHQAIQKKADLFITGDIKHHEALKAKEMGLHLIDVEHFHTEKYFVPAIRKQLLMKQIPGNLLIPSKKMDSPFYCMR